MANDHKRQEQVRAELAALASALLMGPLAPDETIESAPVDTYLTGILWPRGAPVDGIDDDSGLDRGSDPASAVEASVPGYRAIRPCSIGITFAVAKEATVKISLGETSRYVPVEIDTGVPLDLGAAPAVSNGAPGRKAWKRSPLGYSIRLDPDHKSGPVRINDFLDANGASIKDTRLALHVRKRVGPAQHVYTVTLINDEPDGEDAGPRDARCLFQAGIVVEATVGESPGIQPRSAPPITGGDEDSLVNALLYRDVREFAVGHGVAASWPSDAVAAVGEVRTAWLPDTHVLGTSTAGHAFLDEFRTSYPDALKAEFLARESERAVVVEALDAFADRYAEWIDRFLRARLEEFQGDLRDAADHNLARCGSTLSRIRAGVDKLRSDDAVWSAFSLANAAMDRQSRYRAKEHPRPLQWRPFQLAFMLLVIPGLADPSLDDRECMDLLWFPTGGGKTEAYLGLTAFTLFFRRLRGGPGLGDGVAVLMRYTLRLLTVQQFERAARLVLACDLIRRQDRATLGQAQL